MSETKLISPIYGSLVPTTQMIVGQAIFSVFIQVTTLIAAIARLFYSEQHRTRFNYALLINGVGALTLNLAFLVDAELRYIFAALSIVIFTQFFLFYLVLSDNDGNNKISSFPVWFTIVWTIIWTTYAYFNIVLPFPANNIFNLVAAAPTVWFYGLLIFYLYLRSLPELNGSVADAVGEVAKSIARRSKSLWYLLLVGAVLHVIQGVSTVIYPNTVISVSLVILCYGVTYAFSMLYVVFQSFESPVKLGYGSKWHLVLLTIAALIFSSLTYIPAYFINEGFGNIKLY